MEIKVKCLKIDDRCPLILQRRIICRDVTLSQRQINFEFISESGAAEEEMLL